MPEAHNDNSLKWIFTVIAIPIGMEIASELMFAYTDTGWDFLNGLADSFGLEGGIHGSAAAEQMVDSHGAELPPGCHPTPDGGLHCH